MNNETNKQTRTVILALSVIALLVFKIVPILYSTILAFKEFQPIAGFANSPWVGKHNFSRLFEIVQLRRIIRNTVVNNGLVLVVTVVLSVMIVTCLSKITNKRVRMLFSLLLALPAVIPAVLTSQWIIFAVGSEGIINHYVLIYVFLEGFRLSGWVVLVSWLMSVNTVEQKESLHILPVLCVTVLAMISRALTSNLELVNMLSNPLVYDKADVLDSFVYRAGLINMEMGMTSATWVLKFLIQLILGGFAFFGIYQILTSSKAVTVDKQRDANQTPFIVIGGLLSAVIIMITVMMIFTNSSTNVPLSQIVTHFSVVWLFISIVTASLSTIIACVMAYPFTSYNKRVHIIYLAILLPCSYAISIVAQYLLIRTFGLINTIPSLVASHILPVWLIVLMAMIVLKANRESNNSDKGYVQRIVPSAIVLAGVQFSMIWGGYLQPTIMISDPSLFTPTLMIRQLVTSGSTNVALNLVVMLPIIIVWGLIGIVLKHKMNRE